MPRFTTRIHKVGINPVVDIPARISTSFGQRGHVPVLASLGQVNFRATLVPMGGGRHRLYLNQLMRDAAGRETGEMVTVRLELDATSRVLAVPVDLARALRAAGRLGHFLAETPSRRKEIIRWIGGTKNAGTRQRRVTQTVEHFKDCARPVAHRRSR